MTNDRSDQGDAVARSFTPALAFRVLTPLYDTVLELLGLGRSFHREVARLAQVRPGEVVLDLGCGTGTLLETLLIQRPDARYVGVDPDPQVLDIASRKLRRHASVVQLMTGYGDNLPVADRAVDIVVSTLTFHHLTDSAKRSTLAEVRRVLRPAGRFLLIDFGRPTSRAAKVLLTVGSLFDGRANMRANLAGELPTLLHQAGFAVAELRPPRRGVHYLQAASRP
jgi:ubiquinone/menaquinone biosynthesis C-methylase UbiE